MRRLLIIPGLYLILLSACQPATPAASEGLKILTTTTVLADLTRNVVGDRAVVESLLPAEADPHTYEPSPADVAKISESTELIVNGADYEHSLESIIENADGQRQIITASEGLEAVERNEEIDPHFWVNPQFTIHYVEKIRDGLIQADPPGADAYTASAEAYLAQLRDLDTWAEGQISDLPPERRLLVTNHDALGYFAERYGLNVVGVIIPSVSDEAGTAASQMAAVIETIKTSDAPAIFLDEVENEALAEQIASETGARVVDDLYFESLSEPSGPAPNYLEMMRYNVMRIVEALSP